MVVPLSHKHPEAFYDFARWLYRYDPNWVAPLDYEIERLFSPRHNPYLQEGRAQRWLFQDKKGRVLGRIAAFVNFPKSQRYQVPTGGMGFFECVDDYAVAEALFDTALAWLGEQGMQAADAFVNIGENDRFWGVLVEGFDKPPAYGMPYNMPYYAEFLERYGFEVYFKQYSRELDITRPLPARFESIARRVVAKPNVRFAYPEKKRLELFARDFQVIYNDAWQFHEHFTPLTDEKVLSMAQSLKPVMVEELIFFAYMDEEPAGFILALPDLNQIFHSWRGKPSFWQMVEFLWGRRNKFAYFRRRGILDRARVLVMGVRPKFQRKGLEAALAFLPIPKAVKLGFREIELSWVGDFNPQMQAVVEATDAKLVRIHHTYRYYLQKPNQVRREILKR